MYKCTCPKHAQNIILFCISKAQQCIKLRKVSQCLPNTLAHIGGAEYSWNAGIINTVIIMQKISVSFLINIFHIHIFFLSSSLSVRVFTCMWFSLDVLSHTQV